MNKTVSINLGGYFFHIDEEAYIKLKNYLQAVEKSLSDDEQGTKEIINDIELRISELLSEKITNSAQVVNQEHIDEIITIMGQPEDYSDDENLGTETKTHKKAKTHKKIYRDGESNIIGGVCSGIGYYLGIDVVWVRIITAMLFFGFGIGLLTYILLWIITPKATTTSEILQMKGEAVNINNIEKKVREEFKNISNKTKETASNISDKISNTDFEPIKKRTTSGLKKFFDMLGKIFRGILKFIGKFIGIFLTIISGILIVSMIVTMFSISSLEFLNFQGEQYVIPMFIQNSMIPRWLLIIFVGLLVLIPSIVLFTIGLRILFPNSKRISTSVKLTLLGLWLIALFSVGFSAIEYITSIANKGVDIQKKELIINTKKPLTIEASNNDTIYSANNLLRYDKKNIAIEIDHKDHKYSNNVFLEIRRSYDKKSFVEIIKSSKDRSLKNAYKNSKTIQYHIETKNNRIIFDNFFINTIETLHKTEKVYIIIYLAENTKLKFKKFSTKFLRYSGDLRKHLYQDYNIFNKNFIMTNEGFECSDCKQNKKSEKVVVRKLN